MKHHIGVSKPGSIAIQNIAPKLTLNPNLATTRLPQIYISLPQSSWNNALNTAMILPCSVQHFKTIVRPNEFYAISYGQMRFGAIWFQDESWRELVHVYRNSHQNPIMVIIVSVFISAPNGARTPAGTGLTTLRARFVGPTWGSSGADMTQVGPMLAPWSLLSGYTRSKPMILYSPLIRLMTSFTQTDEIVRNLTKFKCWYPIKPDDI